MTLIACGLTPCSISLWRTKSETATKRTGSLLSTRLRPYACTSFVPPCATCSCRTRTRKRRASTWQMRLWLTPVPITSSER